MESRNWHRNESGTCAIVILNICLVLWHFLWSDCYILPDAYFLFRRPECSFGGGHSGTLCVSCNTRGCEHSNNSHIFQPPLYTASAKSRTLLSKGTPQELGVKKSSGIGWSQAGIDRYNLLHEMVMEDRVSSGIAFNSALLNVFLERRRVQDSKKSRTTGTTTERVYPKDDLALCTDAAYKVNF